MTGEPHGDQAVHGLARRCGPQAGGLAGAEIFSDVANKWALLIIEALGERTLRFSTLRDEVEGISHKMLTQNLRMLERYGLLERTVHPVVPPRVEYTLTEPGQALRATIDGLCDWTHRHFGHIEASRRRFDA